MTQEDVIRLAQEVGFIAYGEDAGEYRIPSPAFHERLERFAELVAASEREACAVVAEKLGVHPALNVYNGGPDWYKHGKKIAAEIRARGQE